MSIAPLDIALITLVGFFAVRGIHRGFVRGVLDLVVIVAAARGGALLAGPVAGSIEVLGLGRATPAVALMIATLGIGFACFLAIALLTRPLRRFPVPPPLPFLDGLLGLAPGMVKGIAAAIVVVLPLVTLGADFGLADEVRSSRLIPSFYALGRQATETVTGQFGFELPSVDPPMNAPPILIPLPRSALPPQTVG